MKKTIFLLLICGLSISVQAQKKKTTSKQKSKTAHAKSYYPVVAMDEAAETETPIKIDTLHIMAGKKYVFLVDVRLQDIGVQKIGGDQESEEKELLINFPKNTFEIIKLSNYSYVIFENRKTLEVNSIGNSYKAMAFWSGNLDDNIETQEGLKMATEFVSAQMGEQKESSYALHTRKAKEEIENYTYANRITEKSKQVMATFLNTICIPIDHIKNEEMFLFNHPNLKIKTSQSYLLKDQTKKIPHKSIEYNADGYPTKMIRFSKTGTINSETNFVYDNGMLTNIEGSKNCSIQYDDDKMILSKNVGEADETIIFHLKNNVLLEKNYTLMIDDANMSMNSFSETMLEDQCEIKKINNTIWSRDCSSQVHEFPFIHTYTSYQDGEVLQFRKTKIVKKDATIYEKYYSTAEKESEKDNYKLRSTFTLNDKNLVQSISYLNEEKTTVFLIEYTY